MPSLSRVLSALVVPAALAVGVTGCGKDKDTTAKATSPNAVGANASSSASAVDASFTRQMDAHHELAVSMATIAKHRAKNLQVRTLATNIVRVQNGEIHEMTAAAERLKINLKIAKSQMTTDAQILGLPPMTMGMSMNLSALRHATNFDKAFLTDMIPHHTGAIRMAQVEVAKGHDPQLKQLATRIVAEQNPEIATMAKLLTATSTAKQ